MFHHEGRFSRLGSPSDPPLFSQFSSSSVAATPFRRFLSNLMACQDFRLAFLSGVVLLTTTTAAVVGGEDTSSTTIHLLFSEAVSSSRIQGSFSCTTCSTSWLIISGRRKGYVITNWPFCPGKREVLSNSSFWKVIYGKPRAMTKVEQ